MAVVSCEGVSCSPSTIKSIPQYKYYHVFLSFKGEDTRNGFTDHLYTELQRKRLIVTFKDDRELEKGKPISEQLLKAIEGSLFAIIIFSEGYAFSSWCLDELQQIVQSQKDLGLTVLPIFYGVEPSDIRNQSGAIARAFKKHKKKFRKNKEKVHRWREALTHVANLVGWDTKNSSEARIIEDIVEIIWTKLILRLPSHFDLLVGIQPKVDKLSSLLKVKLDHKCFLGIWGMGGIGKTTLARVTYEAIESKFEASCFLANVRKESESNGLVYLQKELLSRLLSKKIEIHDSYEGVKAIRHFLCNKKVLIVLDDVSHIRQLENLAGNKDWFGEGSKIIVTTRDIHLLVAHEQFKMYEMEMLNSGESLKLLSQKAFKSHKPKTGYLELSKEVAEYSGGLPLALEVLGRFLCQRSESAWRNTLDMMKRNLHKDILETLHISYNDLEDEEYKTIFLDIACFFNWEKTDEVTQILENCGLHPTIGIEVLVEKSLLFYNKSSAVHGSYASSKEFLYMHDLFQEMGRNIVLQESPNDVGRRSRLWSLTDIDLVLKGNKGTKKVQSIVLKLHEPYEANWHPDCFSKMCNLRLLYFNNVHLSHNLNSLPSALKVFIWDKYNLEALPPINELFELVHLQLCHSKVKQLWNGILFLDRLKVINLSHSQDLIEMSGNFNGIPSVKSLLLEGCTNLVTVHESLGRLKKLVKLNLKDCINLVTLPSKLEMDSLEELILSGCSKLEMLPEFGENMKSLSICDVSGTNIREVPPSIHHLTGVKTLSLHGCQRLASISNSGSSCIFSGNFLRLKQLDLSFCNLSDGSIPQDLSSLPSLTDLDLSGNKLINPPAGCIHNLLNLERLHFWGCRWLQSMPELPPNLLVVNAGCCPSMKPLLDMQHLFASFVSEHRDLLLYEAILLVISGKKIPTWFTKQEFCFSDYSREATADILIDVPYVRDKSEWSGITVCLAIDSTIANAAHTIKWSFKNAQHREYRTGMNRSFPHVKRLTYPRTLYIAFFPFNTLNCWQHVKGESRQLLLTIAVKKPLDLKECGWRLICKKDFEVCRESSVHIAEIVPTVN